jgi:uracil-DNA glycosylase
MNPTWQPLFDKHANLIEKLTSLESYYPPKELVFKVFEMDPKDIQLVLLGQDSYHNGCAHGLSFSVSKDYVKIPPSLQNIYKELKNNFPERNYNFTHGNLEKWFYDEKIFLLNCGLSVKPSQPGSLLTKWKPFTDDVIKYIADTNEDCIYLLLGNFAKEKSSLIKNKDKIVAGVHPSPFSAASGFFGSNVFQKVEEKLGHPINWQN